MRASRKFMVIVTFGLVILMNGNYIATEMVLAPPNSLEISYSLSHDPPPPPFILIDGNNDFATQASAKNWEGDGSITNPYVIEGLSITLEPGARGIEIKNTEVYFQIVNCYITGEEYALGIELSNVKNGQVLRNMVIGALGIYLEESSNIVINNNTITTAQGTRGWGSGILIYDSDNNFLNNNRIIDNSNAGIHGGGNFHNNTIINNIITGNGNGGGAGIGICGFYNEIINNTVTDNQNVGIQLNYGTYNVLINNTVVNNQGDGIYLESSTYNILRMNNLVNNGFGFDISGSVFRAHDWLQTEVVDNLVNGKSLIFWQNTIGGTVPANAGQIILINATDVEVTNQNIINVGIGLLAVFCEELNIHDNTFINNSDKGIFLYFSRNSIVRRNNLINCDLGISGETVEDWLQTEVVDNFINGKPLIFWQNTIGGTVPANAGQIILINTVGVEVTNQDVSKAEIGLLAVFSEELNIHDNSFTNNSQEGIVLWYTNNNILANNIVTHNLANGIRLGYSSNNILTSNTVDNNGRQGIFLYYSNNNNLSTNKVAYNRWAGILLRYSDTNTLTNNLVANTDWCGFGIELGSSSNNILQKNYLVNNGGHGIKWGGSHSNTLTNNTIINNEWEGIRIYSSNRNTLTNNMVANNQRDGIFLRGSSNNLFKNNVVANNQGNGIEFSDWYSDSSISNFFAYNLISNNNQYGIDLDQSAYNNTFIWNHFHSNNPGGTSQAYDAYISTSLGNTFSYNYWDDWTSPDVNNDSFVDNPYPIDGNASNEDNYSFVYLNLIQEHYLLLPRLIYPNGREILEENSLTISWYPAYDSHFHRIKYSLYYSNNAGNNWILIADNITSTEFTWNITTLPSDSSYLLKIVATCSEGLTASDISNEPFSIFKLVDITSSIFPTTKPSSSSFLLSILSIFAITIAFRKKRSLGYKRF